MTTRRHRGFYLAPAKGYSLVRHFDYHCRNFNDAVQQRLQRRTPQEGGASASGEEKGKNQFTMHCLEDVLTFYQMLIIECIRVLIFLVRF